MSNYPQYLLSSALAVDGDKTIPPSTSQEAGTGRFSQREGFGAWNSRPIGEGGIPPKREDFNGALYLLSLFALWYQQGGVMQYSTSLDYEVGNEVFSSGTKYRCLVANGPGTEKGLVTPGSDKTVWKNLDAPSVIAGQITPFYNCQIGGSDGRRLIPWGESVADERYVLCDGGSDGMGGNVPNLIGKFILPSVVGESGQTGGNSSYTTSSVDSGGTVGMTVLTIDQIPSHTHTGSSSAAGRHTHTRGTMNIKGAVTGYEFGNNSVRCGGCFFDDTSSNEYGLPWQGGNYGHDDRSPIVGFDASRGWEGETSSSGSHSHTMSLNNTGGGQGHTHSLSGGSHSHSISNVMPPYFKLAYFVKLPE